MSYCPICRLDKKVRHIKVRGLCSESMFNSVYILTMSEEGHAIYYGEKTSSIVFNKTTQLWHWYDQKDSASLATRCILHYVLIFFQVNCFSNSLENSMLLGVNKFDFSKVKDDPCTSSFSSKIVDIKVSACDSGQFTCNDGQCVSIDERCNQISNCRSL